MIPMKKLINIAQAISDESRLRILMSLEGTPLCLQHLTEIFDLAPSTISTHLHILENVGLIRSQPSGRWRYFSWAQEDSDPAVVEALKWVRKVLANDPTIADDAARKAVALQNSSVPPPPSKKLRILFLCTGNSCRSQMAEAILRKHAGHLFEVHSAGLDPRAIPPETYQVMKEIGLDLSEQKPKSIFNFLGKQYFHYVITVCENAESKCPVFPGAVYRLYWPFEDPEKATGSDEERLRKFREVRDQIETRILAWLHEKGFLSSDRYMGPHVHVREK